MVTDLAERWIRRRKKTRCASIGHPIRETDEFYWHDPRLYGINVQKVYVRVRSCLCGTVREETVKTKRNYEEMVLSDELLVEMRTKGKVWNKG